MKNVVALCGGVGGSKLIAGLASILPASDLVIIGNTGDDFCHFGLKICPDLDTVMYRLAGVVNLEQGWGRQDESWQVLEEIKALDGPAWFQLGDRDLAIHLLRTHWLNEGLRLTDITLALFQRLGLAHRLLPMSDLPAPTKIRIPGETLGFQEWFVRDRWQPRVEEVILPVNRPATAEVIEALDNADLIVIAPSNPFVSIDPILNVRPIREMIARRREHCLAVSPLVGDRAVKGPTAKMMAELGIEPETAAIFDRYRPLAAGFIQDFRDAKRVAGPDAECRALDTLMSSHDDAVRLADELLSFGRGLIG